MPTTKSRISGGFLHLELPDEPQEAAAITHISNVNVTGFVDASLLGPAGPMVYYFSQNPRAPAQRPLSDEDFKALLVGLRTSVDSSARATESFKDQFQRVVATMVASNAVVATELKSLRELKQSHRVIFVSSLGSDAFHLRSAIPVELYFEEGSVIAHAPDLEEFGEGDSEYEALEDLRHSIVEEYQFLKANEQSLGAAPAGQLRRFRELIEEGR